MQENALDAIAASGGRCIYADPMGARKTATTLMALKWENTDRILLVAPKAVHGHWKREAAQWFPELQVFVGTGTPAQRGDALEAAYQAADNLTGRPTMYVTSYESMKRDEHALVNNRFDTVVFDEGHRLKGRTTAVAKVANAVTKNASYLLIVTGTPVLNHASEAWQYLHMLDRKTYRSYWRWVNENFIVKMVFHQGQQVREIGGFIPGREEVVRAQLAGTLIQQELDIEDHPWAVEPEYVPIEVELSPKEAKLYTQFVKHRWGKLPSGVVNAGNKLAVTTRLSQLTSDWGNLDETLENGSKVTAGIELIADLARREPVVVFVEYKATARRLYMGLVKHCNVRTYTGDTSAEQKAAIEQSWKDGQVDVVIGTYGSMREGVDGFQSRSSTMVMLDLLWVPGLVDQAIGRLRRSGQRHRVQVYCVYARDTIDATKYEANLRKVNVLKTLSGAELLDVIYGRKFNGLAWEADGD